MSLAAALPAPAAIVWFANEEIPIPTTFEGVSVDLETGASETDADGVVGGDINLLLAGENITNDADQGATMPTLQFVRLGPANDDPVRNMTVGETVDGGTATFSTGFGGSGSPNPHFPTFTPGASGYIGFSLEHSTLGPVYGWMRVTLRDDNTTGGVIHEWAFEDSGGSIQVGAIPEPGSVFLAFLAFAVVALRRKR